MSTQPLNLAVGQLWELRNGWKGRIESTRRAWSVLVLVECPSGYQDVVSLTKEGQVFGNPIHPYDLIRPWVDRPVVNWSALPKWYQAVAQVSDGVWFAFRDKPERTVFGWVGAGESILIPPDYAPHFTGDWRDSLVERPKEAQ